MFKKMWATICGFFKGLFSPSKKEEAKVIIATKVEDGEAAEAAKTINEIKGGEAAKVVLSTIAKAGIIVVSYIVVCNFPLTILLIMEMVAVYGVINWLVQKAVMLA